MTEDKLKKGLSSFLKEATAKQDEILYSLMNDKKSLTYIFQEMINQFGEKELNDYWIKDTLNSKLNKED